ncbi:MAG: tetratricopeptide repeat protein [Sphingobacteriaceae bacterium]
MPNTRINRLLEFLKNEPNEPFLKYALATEYVALGELELALSYFEELIKNHSDYVGTYYHLGKLYEKLGRKEAAVVTYQAGIAVASSQQNAHARSELQAVYQSAIGMDYEDD